ncbi:mammalian cell entry protein [Mycolicibacterium mengxianglii]|uniref:mammalian cell entry protein n=1 Tax=Mycolicibacterium mengxianglii TaxID=2736649 RepID=UPI0018D1779C|nr:mammalian cell entry protein [Mycolicibacterium mengxianglii]
MEDQQSAAGDLTPQDTDQDAEATAEQVSSRRHRMPVGKARRAAATAEPPSAENPVAPEGLDEEATADTGPQPDGDPVAYAGRQPAPRWAVAGIAVAATLFVSAGAFAGATAQPYLAQRALVDTKLDIARTAAEAITTLWTYTPDNMESLADRSARFLGGDFEAQYRKYVDAIAPTNKQAQVTNNTQVVGTAVESLDGADATAIVYTNSTATSPLTKGIPSMRYLSYRLTLQRNASTWLVTSMNTITSLDLTPQI